MMRSLFSAVSGLKSNQTAMDTIGNNIANVNTIGYKSSRTEFQDIFSQTISNATAPSTTVGGSNAKQVGLGVNIASIGMNMTEGSTESTSEPLDFAISGEGLLVVSDGNGGYVYTRNGALQTDAQGYLVTANGQYIMAVPATTDASGVVTGVSDGDPVYDATKTTPEQFGKIQIDGIVYDNTSGTPTPIDKYTEAAIDENGYIKAYNSAGVKVTLGRVVLSSFNNAGGLVKVGSSYYEESANSGAPDYNFVADHCGKLKSGSLEMSNVELSTEMTNMIITQRAYQANARVITTSDSLLEELINLKR